MLARFFPNARSLPRAFINLIFPPRCVICRDVGEWFCAACQSRIEKINPPFCKRCGRPMESAPCSHCQKIPMQIDGVRALAFFQGVMRDAIHRLKYNHCTELAPIFADMLTTYLSVHTLPADVIVPVPLYPNQEDTRGYNQSLLIANELGARLHLPVLAQCLKRTHATRPQFNLTALARRDNVRGAFEADQQGAGMRVLLLDDVCTTGATMDECSIALKRQGVASVWGLALARGK